MNAYITNNKVLIILFSIFEFLKKLIQKNLFKKTYSDYFCLRSLLISFEIKFDLH